MLRFIFVFSLNIFVCHPAFAQERSSYCEQLVSAALASPENFTALEREKFRQALFTESNLSKNLDRSICEKVGFSISRGEVEALDEIQGQSKYINLMLRKVSQGRLKNSDVPVRISKTIQNLDRLFINSPTSPYDIKVFRGGKIFDESSNLQKGDILHWPAFLSTSLDLDVAMNFALGCGYASCDPHEAQAPNDEKAQVFELVIPKSTPIVPIYLFSKFRSILSLPFEFMISSKIFEEAEILLPRNSRILVDRSEARQVNGFNVNWVYGRILAPGSN